MEAIQNFNPDSFKQDGLKLEEGEGLRKNDNWRDMSPAEEDLICRLHNLLGDRWELISGRLPNRNAEEVEKYWRMRKQMLRSEVIKPVCVRAKPGLKPFIPDSLNESQGSTN